MSQVINVLVFIYYYYSSGSYRFLEQRLRFDQSMLTFVFKVVLVLLPTVAYVIKRTRVL